MLRALVRGGLAAALVLNSVAPAWAAPKPLSEPRSRSYVYTHGALTLGALVATGIEELSMRYQHPGYDLGRFAPDDVVRAYFSASAASLSDKLLAVSVTTPLFLQMSHGFDTSMGNATLIYSQTLAFNLLLADTTKLTVRRPRPYTHAKDPQRKDFTERQGTDAFLSFYSAHSSTAFSAATAGSLLYAARTDDLAARHVVWGFEFLMAGITAQLRVRAGRHYRTDIWVGSALGISMGLLVPALHRVELGRVRGSEMATAGGALALTMVLSEAIDFCSALGKLGLCGLGRDISVPLDAPASFSPHNWVIVPAPLPGGAGLSLSGQL